MTGKLFSALIKRFDVRFRVCVFECENMSMSIFFSYCCRHLLVGWDFFIQTCVIIMEVLLALCWQHKHDTFWCCFFFCLPPLLLLASSCIAYAIPHLDLMTIEARARCSEQFMRCNRIHRSTTNESLIVLDFAGFLCVFFWFYCEHCVCSIYWMSIILPLFLSSLSIFCPSLCFCCSCSFSSAYKMMMIIIGY